MPRRTPTQDRIVAFMRDWKANPVNDGNSPTYQDIADGLGISITTVYTAIQKLIQRGKLKQNTKGKLVLPGGMYLVPENEQSSDNSDLQQLRLPLFEEK
ncbi:MAG: winged helix-turn-helix transcriptional regulator [Anaerolineae bacterium]|nr:winged helix-turn-helix transcriptional regulator [Anaerolineae bacterium]